MPGIAKEVRDEILAKVKSGVRVVEVCKQYGVSDKTVYGWLRAGTQQQISIIEHNKLKRENEELKAIVGALTIMVERLKKKRT